MLESRASRDVISSPRIACAERNWSSLERWFRTGEAAEGRVGSVRFGSADAGWGGARLDRGGEVLPARKTSPHLHARCPTFVNVCAYVWCVRACVRSATTPTTTTILVSGRRRGRRRRRLSSLLAKIIKLLPPGSFDTKILFRSSLEKER